MKVVEVKVESEDLAIIASYLSSKEIEPKSVSGLVRVAVEFAAWLMRDGGGKPNVELLNSLRGRTKPGLGKMVASKYFLSTEALRSRVLEMALRGEINLPSSEIMEMERWELVSAISL